MTKVLLLVTPQRSVGEEKCLVSMPLYSLIRKKDNGLILLPPFFFFMLVLAYPILRCDCDDILTYFLELGI